MAFFSPKGAQIQYRPYEARRDIRRLSTKINDEFKSESGGLYVLIITFSLIVIGINVPLSGEIILFITIILTKIYTHPEKAIWNFPWRVPKHAKLIDGSKNHEILNQQYNGNARKFNPKALFGEGVTYYGICRATRLPVYATNSDDRTHLTCLGTTGSGKTEFLLGLVANQLIQDSGFIYCDAKGDPALQREICRLARRFGRDDDVLTINFITSGRDLVRAQEDKVTNTFNFMSDTSSGMLNEMLSSLLDDAGGGGDMWKNRAVSFISSLTVVLTYLRDEGFLQLSPQTYIKYLQLTALEELVFEHNNKYGEQFNKVSDALKNYLLSLPGYKDSEKARKKQDQDTLKQHGFIVMQLTYSLSQLTYDYGYIFGAQQGDIDMFDCVLNRRILTIPLPALERAPNSLKMLGKLCIGSVKQMMASSLGNRIEGVVREILDSRPTNSPNAYKLIFDEFGYIVVPGTSVMPAQGRSLSFSICFAAQDFSDLKRGNEHEAEAIWGNSIVKAIGKLVSGDNGDTMHKVNGVAGEMYQARVTSTRLNVGDVSDSYVNSNDIQMQKEKILPYEDLAGQEQGEFTILISKKDDGGTTAGVKIIRILGFYVAGKPLKNLRMNDLCPNFSISVERMQSPNKRIETVIDVIKTPDLMSRLGEGANILATSSFYRHFSDMTQYDPLYKKDPIECIKAFLKEKAEDIMINSQEFVQTTVVDDITENHPETQYKIEDTKQEELSQSVDLAKAVTIGTTARSELEEKVLSNSSILKKELIQTVEVKTPLAEQSKTVVNIYDLLQYAKECNDRLKLHKVDGIDPEIGYQLLPFAPSHALESTQKVSISISQRLNELQKSYSKVHQVDDDALNLSQDLFDLFSSSLVNMNSFEIKSNANDVEENRARLDRLIGIIELAKGQTKFR